MSNIIITIFNIIIGLVFKIISFVLKPIDLLIQNLLPDVSNGLTAISDFFILISQGLGWAISASGIPYSAIALIATFAIFKYTMPLNLWLIKLAMSWYRTIRP